MTIMGIATFVVGLLPGYAAIGIAAPVLFIVCRLLQGLALGGEYGGAATYVAEHAPHGRRGYYTSWIQTTATVGLFLSLIVILALRLRHDAGRSSPPGAGACRSCCRSSCSASRSGSGCSSQESPAFQRMKDEGKGSKAPLTEAFGHWENAKIAIIALLGGTAGQAVVWYAASSTRCSSSPRR